MKILIYAQHFPPGMGGMEFSNFEIAKGLHNLGHEVEVVTVNNQGAMDFGHQVAFPVTLMPKWSSLPSYSLAGQSRANWIFMPVYANRIKKRIDCFSPDIILVADETANCFWGTWTDKIKLPYMSYCSVPFVSINGSKGNRGILSEIKFAANSVVASQFKRLILKSYSSATWISVVSQSTRKEILSVAPGLKNRMDIIPRSIGDSFFDTPKNKTQVQKLKQQLNINANDFLILTVTNLLPDKGVDDVLRALALLRDASNKTLKYLVVGSGSASDSLKKMSHELGLDDVVTFTGKISHKDLLNYYDACDLFILPSKRGKSESFGRVFAEAAARNKASLGVNEGGMADAVRHGKTGFLLKSGAFNEIRDSISMFLANPEKAISMGNNARKFAQNHFRSSTIANAFETRLNNILEMDG